MPISLQSVSPTWDCFGAVDRVRDAAKTIRAKDETESLARQALEQMRLAVARAESAEVRARAAERQVRAAIIRAEQAEMRTEQAERWLARLCDVAAEELRTAGWR